MSETTVTFLTQTGTDVYSRAVRVFDGEISTESRDFFDQAIQNLLLAAQGYFWDPATNKWELPAPSPGQQTSFPTDSQIEDTALVVGNILAALNTWSQMKVVTNGKQTDNASVTLDLTDCGTLSPTYNSTKTLTTTMNRYMAEYVDKIIRTMRAAGWDPIYLPGSSHQVTARDTLKALLTDQLSTGSHIYDFAQLVQSAANTVASTLVTEDSSSQSDSIQQLLMVDYISCGNELLYNEMSDLNTAINLNQATLSYLNNLQDLMNQKDPQHFLMQLQDLTGTDPDWSQFEQDTFGDQTISNVPKFTDAQLQAYIDGLAGKEDPEKLQYWWGIYPSFYGVYYDDATFRDRYFDNLVTQTAQSYYTSTMNDIYTSLQTLANVSYSDLRDTKKPYAAIYKNLVTEINTMNNWSEYKFVHPDNGDLITRSGKYFDPATNSYKPLPTTEDIPEGGIVTTMSLDMATAFQQFTFKLQHNYSTADGVDHAATFIDIPSTLPADDTTWQSLQGAITYAFDHQEDWYPAAVTAGQNAKLLPDNGASAAFISKASGAFDVSINTIINNLTYLQNKITAVDSGAPLASQLGTIISDFTDIASTQNGSIETWVKDFEEGQEGVYQQHLNNAVVASQSLNDTEREQLNNVMFVYEEFYKSSTAMLSTLDQLLKKIVTNAAR